MLRGQNPFEMIREDKGNPGHFREYTRRELLDLARGAGFTAVRQYFDNYFARDTLSNKLFSAMTPLVPRTWRNGMLMTFRR